MTLSGSRQERRQFWRELCAEYRKSRSEVTQVAFASEHGVSVKMFRKWLHKLRREDAGRVVSEQSLARFVEVKMPSVPLVRVRVPCPRVRAGPPARARAVGASGVVPRIL